MKNKKSKSIKVIKTKNAKTKGHKKFNNKIIFGFIIVILFLLTLFIINTIIKSGMNKSVITINNDSYSKSDYMMYLYSAKYNYFGDNYDQDYEMNTIIDVENNLTLEKYLQNQVLTQLKTATLINDFAYKNNIELDVSDIKIIKEEKNDFIEKLGGIGDFKTFLKKNNSTEKSYDKMAENNALYNKIIRSLYSENKLYDLTDEEKDLANKEYQNEYYKFEQIILTTIDLTTGKNLSETTINQKLLLAKSIVEEANKTDVDFSNLVKKYSESTDENIIQYFRSNELLDELSSELSTLKDNEVSGIIKTKYAIHIVKKLELDDSKLNEYYDILRENKFVESLVEDMDNIKIIYHDQYKKIKIK